MKSSILKNKNYELLEQIGQGAYATIFSAKNTITNEIVAIKKIFKNFNQSLKKIFDREIEIMKKLKCKHSIRFIDYFEDTKNYYIVLEFCDIDLLKYLNNNGGKLPIKVIKNILLQLNEVFRKMNEHNIIHRDLKLQNILLKF